MIFKDSLNASATEGLTRAGAQKAGGPLGNYDNMYRAMIRLSQDKDLGQGKKREPAGEGEKGLPAGLSLALDTLASSQNEDAEYMPFSV